MLTLDAAVQVALSPVVTIPVIAALTVTVVGAIYDGKRRLQLQAKQFEEIVKGLGKLSAKLLLDVIEQHFGELEEALRSEGAGPGDPAFHRYNMSDELPENLAKNTDHHVGKSDPHPFHSSRDQGGGNVTFDNPSPRAG